MAAIFKSEVEYEFDVVGELNQDNEVVITKTRCAELNEKVFKRDGAGIGKILIKWLSDGVEPTNIPAPAPTVATVVANVTSTFGPGVTVEADPLATYRDRIDAVTSVAELKAIAEDLRKLPVADQKLMGKSYSAKMIELNAAGG